MRIPFFVAGLLALGLSAYGGYALLASAVPFTFDFSVHGMERFIESWGHWAAVGSIVLMIVHSFVPVPAEILAVANGMVFGPIWGTIITWIGAMLGAYLAFGLSRALGRWFARTMVPERHWRTLDTWALRSGGPALLICRFIPIISFNVINYAAGLTNISWRTFTWATGLGILPLTTLMVVLGDQILNWPWPAWLAAGIAGLAIPVALWQLVRRVAKRPPSHPEIED